MVSSKQSDGKTLELSLILKIQCAAVQSETCASSVLFSVFLLDYLVVNILFENTDKQNNSAGPSAYRESSPSQLCHQLTAFIVSPAAPSPVSLAATQRPTQQGRQNGRVDLYIQFH